MKAYLKAFIWSLFLVLTTLMPLMCVIHFAICASEPLKESFENIFGIEAKPFNLTVYLIVGLIVTCFFTFIAKSDFEHKNQKSK